MVLILSKLDVYDRFRAGATNRRMRHLFKSPSVWTNVELNGKGFINTVLMRVFRVAGPGLKHLTISTADLTDSTLAVVIAIAQRYDVSNLHTITLGGRGSSMNQGDAHRNIVHNLRRVQALPGLRLIQLRGPLVISNDTYASGFFASLRENGLALHTPTLKMACWPPAEQVNDLKALVAAQPLVSRIMIDDVPINAEQLELLALMASRCIGEMRVCFYDAQVQALSQAFVNAACACTANSLFLHGVDLSGVQLPQTCNVRDIVLSNCTIDNTLCASLPRGIHSLGLPVTSVRDVGALTAFITDARNLTFLGLSAVRVKKQHLTELLLAASTSNTLIVVDLFRTFVGDGLMRVLEEVACRGKKLRVEAACVLCPRTTNENVVFCDDTGEAH